MANTNTEIKKCPHCSGKSKKANISDNSRVMSGESTDVAESTEVTDPISKSCGTDIEDIIMDAEQEVINHAMSEKHKKRDSKEQKDLINRLSRIEGQIRGIKKMIENDAYCPDVLTQVAATRCALNSFSKVLLARHIKTCVTTDIQDGNEEAVDELVELLQKLMK